MITPPRWGVMAPAGFRPIPDGPLRAAGWVAPPFWVERPDGTWIWIVEEP